MEMTQDFIEQKLNDARNTWLNSRDSLKLADLNFAAVSALLSAAGVTIVPTPEVTEVEETSPLPSMIDVAEAGLVRLMSSEQSMQRLIYRCLNPQCKEEIGDGSGKFRATRSVLYDFIGAKGSPILNCWKCGGGQRMQPAEMMRDNVGMRLDPSAIRIITFHTDGTETVKEVGQPKDELSMQEDRNMKDKKKQGRR